VHIADKFSITQALIADVGIRALFATDNMPFHLIFGHPVDKILHPYADKMQHLGQAVLIYRMAQAFFMILAFEFMIDDWNAIQCQ
jgi:hypothetical protein